MAFLVTRNLKDRLNLKNIYTEKDKNKADKLFLS